MRFTGSLHHTAILALLLLASPAWAQQSPLQTATEFARSYIERLPNFTCTRTTQHFVAPKATGIFRLQATTEYDLSWYERDEHYKLISVDGIPQTKIPTRSKSGGWIEMSGNFGWILRQLFDPRVHPHFEPRDPATVNGRQVLVFAFRVARAESRAVNTTCNSRFLFRTCQESRYGFEGKLYLDKASGDIVRIESTPDDLPDSALQGTATVDYARVAVAGGEYLLPISDRIQIPGSRNLFRNDSTYTNYRKFVAEATLKP